MTLRIGIIGCGGIAEVHAEAAAKAGSNIVACCDVLERKARRFAEKHPTATPTISSQDLLSRDDIDAVVVATPNHLHKKFAIDVLRAGKDLLLEKPMALNVAECDEIIAEAHRRKQIVMINFVSRNAPTSLAAHDFIKAQRFGEIYHIKAALYRRRGIPGLGRWFTTKAESGGGVLIDIGVHLIDLALHLAGRPKVKRVSGHCTSRFGKPIDQYTFTEMWAGPPYKEGVFNVEDGAIAMIRCEGGLTIELNLAWAANLPENALPDGMTIFGASGGCQFEVWNKKMAIATEQDRYLLDVKPQLPAGDAWPSAWLRQHQQFVECVQTRTQSPATIDHGRAVQAVIDAIYESSDSGREVEVE